MKDTKGEITKKTVNYLESQQIFGSSGGPPLLYLGLTMLKVSLFQNVLRVSLFGPKYQRKNLKISALESEKWSNHKIKVLHNVFDTLNSPYNSR